MIKKLVLYIGLLCLNFSIFAQNNIDNKTNYKVGLVLSGGGAKGFAHLGILKLIDSLGIKVDYITGTSMGSVMGGLYAMGYSADSIKQIVYKANWARVLSNKVPLNQINIEEKDEYGNYMAEFPVIKGKPTLPTSFIDGQYVSELLGELTFKAKHINQFSQLPIPITITSSDIINGGLVLQQQGSLPQAIKASFAIPAIFSSVYIDGKLLVDGGLDRNFPVEEAINMGANHVIGGYTGFRLLSEKEINSPIKLIAQTHAFASVKDSKKQMEKTNVLIDFNKPLMNIGSSDFMRYKEIIALGEQEAYKYLPQLQQIAFAQKQMGIVKTPLFINDTAMLTTAINFFTEDGEPINDENELKILNKLLDISLPQQIDVNTINKGVQHIFGTRMYKKVYYTFSKNDKALTLNIFLKQNTTGTFKAAVHYDTDQKAGILLNYTFYNLWGKRSRVMLTLDASERLKARFGYNKFLVAGSKNWYSKIFAEHQNNKSNDYLLQFSSANASMANNDFIHRQSFVGVAFANAINTNSSAELGYLYEHETIKQKKTFISNFLDDNLSNFYTHSNKALYAKYQYNTLNQTYFSTKGTALEVEYKYSFNHALNIVDKVNVDSNVIDFLNYFNPSSNLYANKTFTNSNRVLVKCFFAQPLSSKISLQYAALLGVQINASGDIMKDDDYAFLNNKFYVGGLQYSKYSNSMPFAGVKQGGMPLNSLLSFNMALQTNVYKKLFITPSIYYTTSVVDYNIFKNVFNKGEFVVGAGLNIGYMLPIGPLNIGVGKIINQSFFKTSYSIGVGFYF